jgi:signal transduction histidine kinase
MEFLNFPTVALAAALVCLIGITLYAIAQRGSIRSRDEQLVVARAQAYAMLELSHAGVLFLDREHKLMGEASAAAPELLGHTCGAGTAFVQVIAELVPVTVRRETVAYLEALWKAEPTAVVDATQNPLQRVHSGSRHLALRFSRLVVDGRVHHIIASIERISAPRVVPHTIEVPVLNEETFAKRLAGETGTRPALTPADVAALSTLETGAVESPSAFEASSAANTLPAPPAPREAVASSAAAAVAALPPMSTGEFELGSMDVTSDSVPAPARPGLGESQRAVTLAHVTIETPDRGTAGAPGVSVASTDKTQKIAALSSSLPTNLPLENSIDLPAATLGPAADVGTLATTITSTEVASSALAKGPPEPDPSSIIDPPDPRLNEVLEELFPLEPSRVDLFLGEAREKAGQLRAIMKLPAREPQAFREKLVLILELIRGIHSRAERLPLPSVNERADRFEAALNQLRDKQALSGNDFLPLAVKLDDLLSHLAIQGEVATRLREWRARTGAASPAGSGEPAVDATQRSATMTGTTIRQPRIPASAADAGATTISGPGAIEGGAATQKAARLSDLSKESLEEMAAFLADMYSKRVSLVCVGLEDVPPSYRRMVEKLLGQLIHNAIRHGIETPADRTTQDKPEIGTVAVQFMRAGAEGYQLSVQDDGRGLDHERIRAEAVRQGVMTRDEAAKVDPRKLATLIFRAGFTTVSDGGARGIGMDLVRDLVNKANGRVGVATKPSEYTRIRVTLPHEKKDSDAAVA